MKKLLTPIIITVAIILASFYTGIVLNVVQYHKNLVAHVLMEAIVYIIASILILTQYHYLIDYKKHSKPFILRKTILALLGLAIFSIHLVVEFSGGFIC